MRFPAACGSLPPVSSSSCGRGELPRTSRRRLAAWRREAPRLQPAPQRRIPTPRPRRTDPSRRAPEAMAPRGAARRGSCRSRWLRAAPASGDRPSDPARVPRFPGGTRGPPTARTGARRHGHAFAHMRRRALSRPARADRPEERSTRARRPAVRCAAGPSPRSHGRGSAAWREPGADHPRRRTRRARSSRPGQACRASRAR
jgi:hypothetical protein